ncbi:hypothetical protein VFPFJ_01931 [Purpureocillium lilacinum]|uniref:Uncharacterized protein n=1 Tax=Purpureocillium lilacinum TaxID=33203 RepID=A0A179G3F8_PURLI|nr:hypothetical protein VFPFJ_01931 [Purpureocillium lilacinum]OAQ71699.1 hypothetical protein VFPBJ_10478 [Purpureocillium lilacinum]OAQ92770.1 hypothetical protein VFPFJ_01931 [Purpureocillium lilacinum]
MTPHGRRPVPAPYPCPTSVWAGCAVAARAMMRLSDGPPPPRSVGGSLTRARRHGGPFPEHETRRTGSRDPSSHSVSTSLSRPSDGHLLSAFCVQRMTRDVMRPRSAADDTPCPRGRSHFAAPRHVR